MVPATMARWHAGCSHHLQGTSSHCSGDSNMGQAVLCDNEAVVTIINKGTTKDNECMHLVRCLAFIKAKVQC